MGNTLLKLHQVIGIAYNSGPNAIMEGQSPYLMLTTRP
jgi:hypothetical protein